MRFRLIFCFLLGLNLTSCDYFSPQKKISTEKLDTIIDFSSVDTYPSFTICKDVIDALKKKECFRKTIHQKLTKELSEHSLKVKSNIDEKVEVVLRIDVNGKIQFLSINSSTKIKEWLPKLDSVLRISVENLPKVYPAIKRGIPVETEYKLPIQIQLEK